MIVRRSLVLALVAFALVATAGCKKAKVGDACKKEGEVQCLDKTTGLFCVDGKFVPMACEGSTGCMSVAGDGSCTHTNYAVGEPCFKEGEPQCSGDKKSMIKCEKKHWKLLEACSGQLGCVANAFGAKCDLGPSTAGASCTAQNEGNGSCSPDGTQLLICKGGKMVVGSTCKGMHGCRQLGNKLDCNSTIADLNDPCDTDYEGKLACSTDKKTRLVCKSGKFVKEKACKCSVLIDQVNCG